MATVMNTKILLAILLLLSAIAGDVAWQRRKQTAAQNAEQDFWKNVDRIKKTERSDWSGK